METRPKLKPEASLWDKFIDTLIIVLNTSIWGYCLIEIPKVQESNGEYYFLPMITTSLSFIFIILNQFPHVFNYPIRVNEQNALQAVHTCNTNAAYNQSKHGFDVFPDTNSCHLHRGTPAGSSFFAGNKHH